MADVSLDSNRRVLRTCLHIYTRCVGLEFDLQLDGDIETAEELSKKIRKLEKRMNKLRGSMMDDWPSVAPTLRNDLKKMDRNIQDAIENIQDDFKRVRYLTEVLNDLDRVVRLVDPVLQ